MSSIRSRKSRVRIHISRPGSLTKLGYSLHASKTQRHRALKRGVNNPRIGYRSMMAKVNTLYVWNKNRHPSLAKIASADKLYLKSIRPLKSKSPKSKARRSSKSRSRPAPRRRSP